MGKGKKKSSLKRGSPNGSIKDVRFAALSTRTSENHYLQPSGRGLKSVPSAGALRHLERQEIVLWKRPCTTIYYFFLELIWLFIDFIKTVWKYKFIGSGIVALVASLVYVYYLPGKHQQFVRPVEKETLWCLYWIGLGVLSSIGLGSGLHTFLIYLGPHIARVTLAAYECNSLDFPEPPYPTDVTCPEKVGNTAAAISIWSIVSKVRIESLMWGVGTAIGELPPYFVARGASQTGETPDDPDYREFLELQQGRMNADSEEQSFLDRAKIFVEQIVKQTGFFGILLFASIPNPVFDFAGITCGHFGIPFWTFFGATLIGKALVKMHVQMFFVILAFSQHHVENFISQIRLIPSVGPLLEAPLTEFFTKQKNKLHRPAGTEINEQATFLQNIISIVVTLMIAGFLLSIVNSLAQQYHKRVNNPKVEKKTV